MAHFGRDAVAEEEKAGDSGEHPLVWMPVAVREPPDGSGLILRPPPHVSQRLYVPVALPHELTLAARRAAGGQVQLNGADGRPRIPGPTRRSPSLQGSTSENVPSPPCPAVLERRGTGRLVRGQSISSSDSGLSGPMMLLAGDPSEQAVMVEEGEDDDDGAGTPDEEGDSQSARGLQTDVQESVGMSGAEVVEWGPDDVGAAPAALGAAGMRRRRPGADAAALPYIDGGRAGVRAPGQVVAHDLHVPGGLSEGPSLMSSPLVEPGLELPIGSPPLRLGPLEGLRSSGETDLPADMYTGSLLQAMHQRNIAQATEGGRPIGGVGRANLGVLRRLENLQGLSDGTASSAVSDDSAPRQVDAPQQVVPDSRLADLRRQLEQVQLEYQRMAVAPDREDAESTADGPSEGSPVGRVDVGCPSARPPDAQPVQRRGRSQDEGEPVVGQWLPMHDQRQILMQRRVAGRQPPMASGDVGGGDGGAAMARQLQQQQLQRMAFMRQQQQAQQPRQQQQQQPRDSLGQPGEAQDGSPSSASMQRTAPQPQSIAGRRPSSTARLDDQAAGGQQALMCTPRRGAVEGGEGRGHLAPQVIADNDAGRENWVCPICLQHFDEPLRIAQCSHTFCKVCIEGVLRRVNTMNSERAPPRPLCPLCRTEFGPSDLDLDRQLVIGMRQARVRCPIEGCSAFFSPLLSKRHQDECQFSMVACPQQPYGCLFTGLRRDIPAHLQTCPYEKIKGLYPKIRHQMDHMTAAMRGWENALISQQQILASHSAVLRNIERRTAHNPLHHLQLLHAIFWYPHLWALQRERWFRTFSLPTAVMCFSMEPILVSLVVVACRWSWQGYEWTMWHWPESVQAQTSLIRFPYPLIGIDCHGPQGCIAGVSPKTSLLVLSFLMLTLFIEAWDDTTWIFVLSSPRFASTAGLRVTWWWLVACVSWTVYSLGCMPLSAPLYMALLLTFIPAWGLQAFTQRSKYSWPLIMGVVCGLLMHWASWRTLVLACVMLECLCVVFVTLLASASLRLVRGRDSRARLERVVAAADESQWTRVYGALGLAATAGILLIVPSRLELLKVLAIMVVLWVFMFVAELLVKRIMDWAAQPSQAAARDSREMGWRVMSTRGLLVLTVLGTVMLCLI